MPIVNIHFTKLSAERKKPVSGTVDISHTAALTNVTKKDLKPGQSSLVVEFDFNTKIDPMVGTILLSGELIMVEETKNAAKMMDEWKKTQRLPTDTMAQVMNAILTRCNIEALVLGRDVGLPPTIRLPKVTVQYKAK